MAHFWILGKWWAPMFVIGFLPVMLCRAVWGNLHSSTCKEGHRSTVETKKMSKSTANYAVIYNRSVERDESGKYRLGPKKKERVWEKKETAGCQQRNVLRTRCADRGLTGCLAPSFSAPVSSVWWICSQPVRGSYQKSAACQSGGRMGGEMRCAGRQRPCESLWSTVNWSLWGQGPWLRQMYHEAWLFPKKYILFFTWKCLMDSQTF